ncbi:MAG: hypothetical protein ACRDSF_14180 [Pseudonocardiaceae bacterium]
MGEKTLGDGELAARLLDEAAGVELHGAKNAIVGVRAPAFHA